MPHASSTGFRWPVNHISPKTVPRFLAESTGRSTCEASRGHRRRNYLPKPRITHWLAKDLNDYLKNIRFLDTWNLRKGKFKYLMRQGASKNCALPCAWKEEMEMLNISDTNGCIFILLDTYFCKPSKDYIKFYQNTLAHLYHYHKSSQDRSWNNLVPCWRCQVSPFTFNIETIVKTINLRNYLWLLGYNVIPQQLILEFLYVTKHLDWLIGNATDTGVPEEEEEEFPAQVAGSKLRDVFIALPGIRASVRRNTGSTWLSSTWHATATTNRI